MIRTINRIIVSLLYRVKDNGLSNIPATGGGLIVANHITFSDPSILLATIKRPVRFLMYRPYYENKFLHFFASRVGAIPVSYADGPKSLLRSLDVAREAILRGELVGIFAEGELTRLGNLLPFGRGVERIMKGVNAPIIPIHLDSLWGSFFSHRHGKPLRKVPRKFPYPVSVSVGQPLPGNSKSWEVRQAIQELGSNAFEQRPDQYRTLAGEFIRTACRRFFSKSVSDTSGVSLSYGSLLTLSMSVARNLKSKTQGEESIGIMLPASVGGVVANCAVALLGKPSVNLNYTLSLDVRGSAIKQCGIKTVISSKQLLEKLGEEAPSGTLFIEDLIAKAKGFGFVRAWIAANLLPAGLIEMRLRAKPIRHDDVATIIFSSGSTGEPKGVMLTHRNIRSNVIALAEVFQVEKRDSVVGVLPFFHSFGFTGTLWFPLLLGLKAAYHGNPLDAGTIGELVKKSGGTIFMSTPTFLLAYIRKCTAEQFKTLRTVVVGAEKLREKIAEMFKEKFGITPMEGYGCSELSPVAMVNVKSFKDDAVSQVGAKLGSVGHPLPGVTARIIDPESFELLPPGSNGLLLVRGPNVMKGYLNNPVKTDEVIRNGWYVTGDIAAIDDDGFVTITDRLSRFSKIGGEMVPHLKIEEEIHAALSSTEQVCAVTAIPDEKRGEQLVVIHSVAIDVTVLTKDLQARGVTPLWIPKRENFIQVEKLPLLGSGKLDLKALKAIAAEKVTQKTS